MTMGDEPSSDSSSVRRRRAVESVVLARMIERGTGGLTEAQVVDEMTTIADPPERIAAIRLAIEELVEVGLLVSVDGLLRPTPAGLRSGELELGL
jgi:hypothetical protein